MFGAFGRVDTPKHIVVENDKVVFTADKQEYKTAVKYINPLFQEGLIDREAFSHQPDQYSRKGMGDQAVLGSFIHSSETTIVGEKSEDYIALAPPLKGPDGHQKIWVSNPYLVNKGAIGITASNQHPVITIRWIDRIYEQLFIVDHTNHNAQSGDKTEQDELYETMKEYIIDEYYPDILFSAKDLADLSFFNADLIEFVNKRTVQWIVNGNIDEEWDDYLKKLNRLRVDEYVAMHQKYLDRS